MTAGRWLLAGSVSALAVVLLAGIAVAWHPALTPIEPPAPASFDKAEIRRGEGLALIGDCAGCHTAEAGKPLAGGRPMTTAFGTLFTTNITPDRETGIGRWSREAFVRAMRSGVAQNGDHLYPAFPYDHFTKASEPDLAAIYAWLMTRRPIAARAPHNQLNWPFGWRPLMAAWNLRYLGEGPLADDPSQSGPGQSTDWNRGRTLVEGLAHCGACHTPRDRFGGEDKGRAYDGAMVEGWYAPALGARSPAVRAWTADRLFVYLRTGLSPSHAAAAGPMGEVTRVLARAPETEVRAIAVYVAWLMRDAPSSKQDLPPVDKQQVADQAHPEAALLFAGACAGCHDAGAPMMLQGRPPLSWGTPLHEDTSHDTVRILMQGLAPPAGQLPGVGSPTMPAFADSFTDRQLADIAAYLRARYTDKLPWPDLAETIGAARLEKVREAAR